MTRILVVDDEEIICKRLKDLLELDGYKVCTAKDGKSALRVFAQCKPAIALVDIKMPGMDGIELLTRLKQRSEYIEVIIFTGHGGVDTAIRAMKLGAFGYIQKPIEYDELIIDIKRALAKQAMQKKLDDHVQSLEQAVEAKNREIAERQKIEAIMGEQSKFLQNVLESLTHPFYIINADDYTITTANSATKLPGPARDITCYMFTHDKKTPCSGQGNICPLQEVKKTRQPVTVEHVHQGPGGAVKYVEVHAFPITNEAGEVKQVIEYVIDITERKRAEELERAKAIAEQASKIKSQFLANVSHEIRTPLNAIIGFAGLLKKTEITARQKDFIDTIQQSGSDLLNLINGILDISVIEANRFVIADQVFNLDFLLQDCVKIEEPKLRSTTVKLRFTFDGTLPAVYRSDSARLKQIVINLLDNAVKFTENGRIELSVRDAGKKGSRRRIEIRVADTGIGIPSEQQHVIFEPFTQADSSSTRIYGGAGLGLHITKLLVERLGGSISMKSEQGKGSEFTVSLALVPVDRSAPQTKEYATGADAPSIAGTRVLVAEDSPVNQRLIRLQLEGYGCAVEVVDNGADAVETLKSGRFDICLMDVQMPGVNGLEAASRIRGSLKTELPIIALTASAMKGDEQKCLAAGMNDFIAKPINQELLKRKIHALLPLKSE
jgi:signal transduction histidine kinase/DNA-binding response OmpR family regulator